MAKPNRCVDCYWCVNEYGGYCLYDPPHYEHAQDRPKLDEDDPYFQRYPQVKPYLDGNCHAFTKV